VLQFNQRLKPNLLPKSHIDDTAQMGIISRAYRPMYMFHCDLTNL